MSAKDPDARLAELLAELGQARAAYQRLEHLIIHFARDFGMSWDRIGEAHDPPISNQRAGKRYSHPKPRRGVGEPHGNQSSGC